MVAGLVGGGGRDQLPGAFGGAGGFFGNVQHADEVLVFAVGHRLDEDVGVEQVEALRCRRADGQLFGVGEGVLGAAGGEHQSEGQGAGRGEGVREVLGVVCGGIGGADQQPRKGSGLVFARGVLVVFQEQFAEVSLRGAQVRYGAQAALGESGG